MKAMGFVNTELPFMARERFLLASSVFQYLNLKGDGIKLNMCPGWLCSFYFIQFIFKGFIGSLSSILLDKSTTSLPAFGTIYYVIKIVICRCFSRQQRLRISLPPKCLSQCKGQKHIGENAHKFGCDKVVLLPQTSTGTL